MDKKNIQLSKIELDLSKIDTTNIFQNYTHSCGEFTYHADHSSCHLLNKFNIKNYFIKIKPSDLLSKINYSSFSEYDSFIFEIQDNHSLNDISNFLKSCSIKNIKKIRFYINTDKRASSEIFELAGHIIKPAEKFLPNTQNFSLCLQSSNFINALHLNEEITKKYPEICDKLHFEPPAAISSTENAIFFTAVFQNREFKNPSICPAFSDAEKNNSFFYKTLEILRSIGFSNIPGIFLIACPTCTRTRIGVIELARKIYESSLDVEKTLKIAVMGCEVNGPGEASQADFGVAGGLNRGVIFEKGKIIKQVALENIETELNGMLNEHK